MTSCREMDLTDYHVVNDSFTVEGYWYDYDITYVSYDSTSIKLKIDVTQKECTDYWINENPVYNKSESDDDFYYSYCLFIEKHRWLGEIYNNNQTYKSQGSLLDEMLPNYYYAIPFCEDYYYYINIKYEDFEGYIKIECDTFQVGYHGRGEELDIKLH